MFKQGFLSANGVDAHPRVTWDSFLPARMKAPVTLDELWRMRLMGSGLALLAVLFLVMSLKDLTSYGWQSPHFLLSLTCLVLFAGCFAVFKSVGWESGVFLTVLTVGHAVLFYSIYRTGDPHPSMIVWIPIVPFLLSVYRGPRLVLASCAATLAFLALYWVHLHQAGGAPVALAERATPGAFGELVVGLLTATALAMLFRTVVYKVQADLSRKSHLVQAQSHAMQMDLEHASAFQRGLMPQIRETKFLNLATVFQPAGLVSGDVYAIYYNREGALNVFLGDASGHGVTSAFLTMMVHIGLHQQRADLPPSTILERLNANLNEHNLSDMFVTGAYLRIEPTGRLTISHAGHPSVLVRRAGTGEVVTFHENGVPMGLFGTSIAVYQNETLQLNPGDIVLLHTDGIAELSQSRDADAEQYGMERLSGALSRCTGADLEGDLQSILRDAEAFAAGTPYSDDLSLIALRMKDAPGA